MKNKLILWFTILVAGFLLGFVPQYSRARRLNMELSNTRNQVSSQQRNIDLCQLREAAAMMYSQVSQKNYGIAGDYSTRFFQGLAAIRNQTTDTSLKKSVDELLAMRNSVTAALAKGDPSVLSTLQEMVTHTAELANK